MSSRAIRRAAERAALKHGSCSTATLILPTESLADFEDLENRWLDAYNPQSSFEFELICTAARADRNYAEAEFQTMSEEPNVMNWTEAHHKSPARSPNTARPSKTSARTASTKTSKNKNSNPPPPAT